MAEKVRIKEIPHIPGFYATTDGKILDKNKKEIHQYIKPTGYVWASFNSNEYAVHDIILKTFEPIPLYLKGPTNANHFDMDRTNNHLSNLDWVDRRFNGIHGHLMKDVVESESSWINAAKDDGTGYRFYNLAQAADFFNVTKRRVWDELKTNGRIKGYTISYRSKVTQNSTRDDINKSVARDRNNYGTFSSASRPIKIMNLATGNVERFDNMNKAAKHFGVGLTSIRNRLSTPEKPKVLNSKYVIIDADKDFSFLNERLIKELRSRGSTTVVVYDEKDGSYKTYLSARSFLKKHSGYKGARSYVAKALKIHKTVKFKEYIIALLPQENEHQPDLYLIEQIARGNVHKM